VIKSLLLAAVFATLLPACPLLDVQVDVPEVCVTYHDVHVDGMPAGETMIEKMFTVDHLDQAKQLADQGATVQFVRAEIRATSGITGFDFVHQAKLTIASADETSTLPAVEVYDCEDCATSGATLDVQATSQVDPNPYLASGSLLVTIDLAGQAPADAWTMDVDICMSGTIDKKFSP
jgi:hypothetical protein